MTPPRITLNNVAFRGGGDTLVPAFCPRDGFVQAYIQSMGLPHANLGRVEGTCQVCGGPAAVLDGFYEFSERVRSTLERTPLTKKQAERFLRKVAEAREPRTVPASVATISPELGELSEAALAQPDPVAALGVIVGWVKTIFGVSGSRQSFSSR